MIAAPLVACLSVFFVVSAPFSHLFLSLSVSLTLSRPRLILS